MAPHVIKGSPISLDLSEAGGGQLLVGNNTNDNKVFLQAVSTDGQANAAELLITGRFITSLPLVSVLADITRIVGHLQIGEGFGPAFTISPSDASPNAGFIRFGDSTGWKLHFGRSREVSAGPLNTGTTGVLLTIEDNGRIGIGDPAATCVLDWRGTCSRWRVLSTVADSRGFRRARPRNSSGYR